MQIITKYLGVLIQGGLTTLLLFSIVTTVGLLLGIALGHIQYFSKAVTRKIISTASLIIVSCPILVLLYWAYFPLQESWSSKLSPFWTSVVVLTLLNSIMIMDVTYRGIQSMPANYLSLRKMYEIQWTTFFIKIWFPTLFVMTLHSILLIELSMLHATLFAALIGTEELFRAALRINAVEIDGNTVFTVMAFVFILVSVPIHLASKHARDSAKKIIKHDNEF